MFEQLLEKARVGDLTQEVALKILEECTPSGKRPEALPIRL